MSFGFYAGSSGLYQPTDGNLYAPRQLHGTPDFAPLIRYEGSGVREATATGRNPQTIDDKLPGSLEARMQDAETSNKPYLLAKEMTQYLQ